MRKSTRRETEERLRELLKDREVPEFKPDFEKFKREYLDKAPPPTEEDFRRIEEWNAQVRVERMQKVRRVASVAACAVLALAVVGSAMCMNLDSAVVPNDESSEVVSGTSSTVDTTTSATATTTTTTDLTWLEKNRQMLEEARTLTGLPLVSAEGMDGFEGYSVDIVDDKIVKVVYAFESCNIYVYCDGTSTPESSDLLSMDYAGKNFLYEEMNLSEIGARILAYYQSQDGILFVGDTINKTIDENIQLLNTLIFEQKASPRGEAVERSETDEV